MKNRQNSKRPKVISNGTRRSCLAKKHVKISWDTPFKGYSRLTLFERVEKGQKGEITKKKIDPGALDHIDF